ncbi:MAG: general secretion pathway protein GspK [Candidatus Rokubacteria bacterium]|nr:general secretion pathway protein GspK [Candidatus Rokubacteria bacterium]
MRGRTRGTRAAPRVPDSFTGSESRPRDPARERGFALVAVLLVMALLGVVGAEFAFSMRLEASAVRAYKEAVIGAHLAEAAVEQAVREIVGDVRFAASCNDGPLTFYRADRTEIPRLPRQDVPLAGGTFSYVITDEESRLNLNTTRPDRLDRLLQQLEIDKSERDTIVASIQDWRDPNEEYRLNGAESEDTYLEREVPYRSKNGNLDSIEELRQIKGVTPEIFEKLAPLVAVKSGGRANLNTARREVLQAYGLADAETNLVLQARCEGPYAGVPGQFGARGVGVITQTFRIEAEGQVDGRVGARITAVVQRRDAPGGASVAFLEWSGAR